LILPPDICKHEYQHGPAENADWGPKAALFGIQTNRNGNRNCPFLVRNRSNMAEAYADFAPVLNA